MNKLLLSLVFLLPLAIFACSDDDDDSQDTSPDADASEEVTPQDDVTEEEPPEEVVDEQPVEIAEEEEPVETCEYPTSTSTIACGKVMPPLYWEGVTWGEDTDFDFSLTDFYCSDDYDEYEAVVFVVITEWCQYCPGYIDMLDESSAAIEAAGGLLVFVDAQNNFGGPASNLSARYLCDREGARDLGICVGDGETRPNAGAVYNMPSLEGVPTGFVVRRSDMVVVADQSLEVFTLDYAALLENIDEASCEPPPPTCDDEDEETYEPNDTPETRATIPSECFVSGVCSFAGGICTSAMDFYQINLPYRWQLDLLFSQSQGDLDTYVWDVDENTVFTQGGVPVGSDSSDDDESFQFQGTAAVVVWGYRGATAPYTLTITDLGE